MRASRRKILFLMHVDWRWIKQRPHFLAEEAINDGEQLLVLFKPNRTRLHLPRNRSRVRRLPLLPVPHSSRHRLAARLGRGLQRGYVGFLERLFKPEIVYVTHPLLWSVVPHRTKVRAKAVYDCMDDAVAMARPQDRSDIAALERDLSSSAVVVTASSARLVSLLAERCGRTDVTLVRNGLTRIREPTQRSSTSAPAGRPKIALYVGTIAHWLDWTALEVLRDSFNGVVRLVGPRPEAGLVPEGIECRGPVEHAGVFDLLEASDLLLLPFAPGEIVSAVDPVKMYEYVGARRPVLARYFPELEPFRRFVTFYEQPDQVAQAATAALSSPLPDEAEVREFLNGQLWCDRWAAISDRISKTGGVAST